MNSEELHSIVKHEIATFGRAVAPPPVVFQCFNILRSAEDETYPLHAHEFCEAITPLSGSYKCLLNGDSLSLEPGELLFIQYEDQHEDFFQAGATYATLRFELSDERLKRPFPQASSCAIRKVAMDSIPSLSSIFKALEAESGEGAMLLGVMEGLCQAFFWKLMKCYPETLFSQEFLRALSLKSAKDALRSMFREATGRHFDLELAARRLGVSRRTLYGLCDEAFGLPPAKAFLKFKMHEAARILTERDVKVQDLAARFGFDDKFHFSRAFKRCLGMSPSEFRANA